ncbi:uncharacterized protein LOC134542880 [Bacillus rossius redtenbacheri]|uniref:uncharacterized protein LOC134542880 n=1 Tax=Bacillus rossius redtenbacheri TaxID=93214 RepID=UPI002FDD01B9
MDGVWQLAVSLLLVRGGSGDLTILQSLVSNHVASGMSETTPLGDITVTVDEWSLMILTHLRLSLTLDTHHLQVCPDFNSSILGFSLKGGSMKFVGDFKLRNATSFLSKGRLDVSLTDLEVSGTTDLLLGDRCISTHGHDVRYESRGHHIKYIVKNGNSDAGMDSVLSDSFLSSFEELVRDEVTEVIRRRILENLNSVLCSIPIETLLGGEWKEHLYRRRGLKPVPQLNEIIDTVLENLKTVVLRQGFDVYHLPDINTTFVAKESIFKLHGTLLAENGTLRNLTSVRRTSDCVLAGNGSFFFFSGGFGMGDFNITFDYINALFEGIEFVDKISVSFDVTSVFFKATMKVINSTCYPAIDNIHVDKLDKMHVTVEGNKAMLIKDALLLAFARYKHNIMVYVDSQLKKLGDKYLKSFDCGNYFGVVSNYLMPHSRRTFLD